MNKAQHITVSISVLSTDFVQLGANLQRIHMSGADSVHLDIMDGRFVPNISFGWSIAADIVKASRIPCGAHLMIERPEDAFDAMLATGVNEVLFHVEATRFPFRALDLLKRPGIRRGVAVNPATPVASVIPLLESLDTVLLMSVEPGFGGQPFLPGTLTKVRELRSAADRAGLSIRIAVDGGVDMSNATALRDAGATELSAGSAFFRATDPSAFVRALRGE
ncbi:ribulose-phosphate 3-epimerase [bacterium]|nr:ribulose-phosphate 3-epimerase [bacterium]